MISPFSSFLGFCKFGGIERLPLVHIWTQSENMNVNSYKKKVRAHQRYAVSEDADDK